MKVSSMNMGDKTTEKEDTRKMEKVEGGCVRVCKSQPEHKTLEAEVNRCYASQHMVHAYSYSTYEIGSKVPIKIYCFIITVD